MSDELRENGCIDCKCSNCKSESVIQRVSGEGYRLLRISKRRKAVDCSAYYLQRISKFTRWVRGNRQFRRRIRENPPNLRSIGSSPFTFFFVPISYALI